MIPPNADPRGPLYLTKSEASNWMSLHSHDVGREIIIVEWRPAERVPELIGTPFREALGYNARGEWVWKDEAEGRWP